MAFMADEIVLAEDIFNYVDNINKKEIWKEEEVFRKCRYAYSEHYYKKFKYENIKYQRRVCNYERDFLSHFLD